MSDYTLTSERVDGQMELRFLDGRLNVVKILLKQPLTEPQFRALLGALPQYEGDIARLEHVGLTVKMDAPANVKLALFCRLYENYKKVKYQVSARDSGQIKLIKVTEELLVFYFNASSFLFKGKHSISNLVKYYNELLADFAISTQPKPVAQHPDYFDEAYQNKLSGKEITGYWQHLWSIGLVAKKDRSGNIVDWYRPEAQ